MDHSGGNAPFFFKSCMHVETQINQLSKLKWNVFGVFSTIFHLSQILCS